MPTVSIRNNDGTLSDYYLFGEREEPYDVSIHREMRVADQNAFIVKDAKILSSIPTLNIVNVKDEIL